MLVKLKRWALITLIVCGGLFLLSGQYTSPLMWSLMLGISGITLYAMLTIETDLANERFRPPSPGADPVALRWVRISALMAMIVAPLDGGRFHWSPLPPDGLRIAAMAGTFAAFLLCFRAMIVNRYFSSVIRIQHDRGHRVVDSGPYSLIRHPGYAGMIAGVPMLALALGSWWGVALAGVYSLLIARRVSKEDRFLREHLPGYPDYATRVRYRLLPGVW